MTYTITQVGISDAQLHELMQGVKIHLEKHQFHGSVALPFTKAQVTLVKTASRGFNLKMSGPQIKWLQSHHSGGAIGDDFADIGRAALPAARAASDFALDKLQSMIPTNKLGDYQALGDAGVAVGRQVGNKLLDYLQRKLGGSVGRSACDAKMGCGWFDQYLLPGLESAARIAMPIIKGNGTRAQWKKAVAEVHGAGWFDQYLLPGLETAAKIAMPLLGGGLHSRSYKGAGWFDQYLLPGLETAAKIGIPLLTGGSILDNITSMKLFGGKVASGWQPMTKKKAAGLVL